MTFISTLLKAAAALFMLVILMLLVQLDLTAFQTVEVLAPGWGWLAFVSLLAGPGLVCPCAPSGLA